MPRDENEGGLLPPLSENDLQRAIYGLTGIFEALDLIDENDQRMSRANLIAAGKIICQRITDQF